MNTRIGYCGRKSKWESFHWQEFIEYAASHNIEVVPIDLKNPIENQGHFDLIIHKMTNVMDGHNMNCNEELNCLYKYTKEHPEVIIIDDLDSVAITLDREETDELLKSIQWKTEKKVSCPNSSLLLKTDLDNIKEATKHLNFPILAKPKAASLMLNTTKEYCHMLRIATSPEDLVNFSSPCLLQEYINHNGIIYKLYAIGSELSCDIRPSTRDIKPEETINLDFHSEKPEVNNGLWTQPRDFSEVQVPMNDFLQISADLRSAFNIDLLGFDVIIDKDGYYWIIDVNFFPSYRGVKDVWPKFLNFFMGKIGRQLV
ncbi:Inositol-tetrakisphosphate 1-kinase [Tritrichomonas musculus]|uniref:Inositol-tetrakisphosphate 1-kinase n=1 Tax=Tritrichomonas musculus TaxID=1915356 RepID=A0ABR2HYJ6_9EUKA